MINAVTFEGDFFYQRERDRAFQISLDKTIAFGVDVAASYTPVRTGNLKSRWEGDDDSIFNDEYYAKYVDDGTSRFSGRNMTLKSVPDVTEEFIDNVIDALENL
jgi:hypothetical protein